MYQIKNQIYLDMTKTQKSALCNFLRALVKKSPELSVDEILDKFFEDERYYFEINNPHFEFLENYLDDEKFLSDTKLYLKECRKYYDYKKKQEPIIQAQKEFEKKKRAFLREVKMSKDEPTKKQLYYYERLCKKYNIEKKELSSKLEARDEIDRILNEYSKIPSPLEGEGQGEGLMTIQEILKILTDSGIEPNEANVEIKMLLEHFANYGAKDVILGKKLTAEKLELVREKALLRAKTRQPVQHIIGFADFMGENFIVNPSVLIPRDETEILVRKAVEIINENDFKMALDVGTGSGCIACMIAKHTDCQIIGLDISTDALNTALDNASRLNLFNKAIFRKSDIFSNVKPGESFDVIVSNPPYISPCEKKNIQKEVTFDPEIALYTTDEKGLEFYKKITAGAPNILNKGGYLLFELGVGQFEAVKSIMEQNGFQNLEIIKDLAGIDRVIAGKLS